MTVVVDTKKCTGCKGREKPLCVMLCPGDLMMIDEASGKAAIREPGDCWDCMACVKACPFAALETRLPYELGYHGARLVPKKKGKVMVWELTHLDGRKEVFERKVRL